MTEPGVPAAAAPCQRKLQEDKPSLRYSREKVNHRHGYTEPCLESNKDGLGIVGQHVGEGGREIKTNLEYMGSSRPELHQTSSEKTKQKQNEKKGGGGG